MRRRRLVLTGLVCGLLALPACASVGEEEEPVEGAAKVEEVAGSDVPRVILTPDAEERIDVRSAEVATTGGGTEIPYAAVFYTAEGDTWTYTSPEPHVFVRVPIAIDRIDGDQVFLSDGPPAGTAVVTLGSAELFGTETGVEE